MTGRYKYWHVFQINLKYFFHSLKKIATGAGFWLVDFEIIIFRIYLEFSSTEKKSTGTWWFIVILEDNLPYTL